MEYSKTLNLYTTISISLLISSILFLININRGFVEKNKEEKKLYLINFCQHQTCIYKENNTLSEQCICRV